MGGSPQALPMRTLTEKGSTWFMTGSFGLLAQFGFLCDVIVADVRKGIARHICELPVDYVHESEIGRSEHYYTISFEWGAYTGDVFKIERHPSFQRAHESKFLHPIVRRF